MYVCAYLSVFVRACVYLCVCVCVYARTRVSVCVSAYVCVRAGALEHLFSSGRRSSQQTVPVLPLYSEKTPGCLLPAIASGGVLGKFVLIQGVGQCRLVV